MFEVIIVGAGPVGLYLGALLLQEGLSVRILDQRSEPSPYSRAIGIHPPALAALERAGVACAMVAEGVQIPLGIARSGGREVGRLSFAQVCAQHPFVLTLEQVRTEAILAARVQELDPSALERGICVNSLRDAGDFVTLTGHRVAGKQHESGKQQASGEQHEPAEQHEQAPRQEVFQAKLVIGADGARSTVRRLLGIATSGRNHPDTYLMGDFPDVGIDGPTAILYLEPGGIVESFPLPGGLRRWVAHTDSLLADASAADLAALIQERTGVELAPGANSMLSAFAVRSRMARGMVKGRAALVGDAAHEVSPIGGQGMNLGWLDASALAPIIVAALRGEVTGERLKLFQHQRTQASRAAARQAWLNMALGRPGMRSYLQLRHAAFRAIIRSQTVHDVVARRFTMTHGR